MLVPRVMSDKLLLLFLGYACGTQDSRRNLGKPGTHSIPAPKRSANVVPVLKTQAGEDPDGRRVTSARPGGQPYADTRPRPRGPAVRRHEPRQVGAIVPTPEHRAGARPRARSSARSRTPGIGVPPSWPLRRWTQRRKPREKRLPDPRPRTPSYTPRKVRTCPKPHRVPAEAGAPSGSWSQPAGFAARDSAVAVRS